MGGGLSLPSPSNYMCADGDVGLHGLLMLVDVLPSSSGRRLFKISDELKVRNGTKSDFMALHFQFQKLSFGFPLATKVLCPPYTVPVKHASTRGQLSVIITNPPESIDHIRCLSIIVFGFSF
jgi:hypothetical protein